MHPYHHALSSVKRFGGVVEDYIEIHNWFDGSKRSYANFRHRALRHHAEGIFDCEDKFGVVIRNNDGKTIPVRQIGEQHVTEDLGFIPTMKEWYEKIPGAKWMFKNSTLTSEQKQLLDNDKPVEIGKILQ